MKVTVLGSGTSSGVPQIGCDCEVCTSVDPRNRRTRCSVMVSYDGNDVLIDTATDLRHQALSLGIRKIDAVLYTHNHADHVHGIDDLRAFNFVSRKEIPIYGPAWMMEFLRAHFDYIFTETQMGGGKPKLALNAIDGSFDVLGRTWSKICLMHGKLAIAGYRVGAFAYLTDCSAIPEASYPLLEGLDVLIIDALREGPPHPTHFTFDEALAEIDKIRPRRAFFTHLTHRTDHATLSTRLPDGVEPAYDGLVLEIDEP